MAIDNAGLRSATALLTPFRRRHVDHDRLQPATVLPLGKALAMIAVLTALLLSAVALRAWIALQAVHAW